MTQKIRFRGIACILLCVMLLASGPALAAGGKKWICPNCGKENSASACTECGTEKLRDREDPGYRAKDLVGETITFGRYEQDSDPENGPEPIEWLVLASQGDRVLAVSLYALDCRQYHESFTEVTWETCTLRGWLNDEFLNTAFSYEEKAGIPPYRSRRTQTRRILTRSPDAALRTGFSCSAFPRRRSISVRMRRGSARRRSTRSRRAATWMIPYAGGDFARPATGRILPPV